MTNKKLLALLTKLDACQEAIDWIQKDKLNLKQAWLKCKRADWLIWFAGKTDMVTHQELVLVACCCAETALKYVPKGEDRPRLAIEAARRWAKEPTEENRDAAHAAAYAAHAAAYAAAYAAHAAAYAAHAAADAAAYAAHAADAAAHAADAAAHAADAAAHAADAAAHAADAAAYAAAQKNLCRIVRKMIKLSV